MEFLANGLEELCLSPEAQSSSSSGWRVPEIAPLESCVPLPLFPLPLTIPCVWHLFYIFQSNVIPGHNPGK